MHHYSTNVLFIDPDNTFKHIYTYLFVDIRLEFEELFLFLLSHVTRGIRQGCRLSALRFVLIVETMAAGRQLKS